MSFGVYNVRETQFIQVYSTLLFDLLHILCQSSGDFDPETHPEFKKPHIAIRSKIYIKKYLEIILSLQLLIRNEI